MKSSTEDLSVTSEEKSEAIKKIKSTLISLAVNTSTENEVNDTKDIVIRKQIGKNEHSIVFSGETTGGKKRALIASQLDDKEIVEEFINAFKSNFVLKHPNIVKVFECVEINGIGYAVCELFEAVSLHELIQSIGVFETKEEFYTTLSQICEAVAYSHGQGVIHGNLKTSNILLCEIDGKIQLKLTGFGRTKFKALSLEKQKLRPSIEEVSFWSPEHCMGKPITESSDVYQVALIAYFMITGNLPYDYKNPESIVKSHKSKELKPKSIIGQSKISCDLDDLESLIFEALETEPSERISSISKFRKKLDEWYQKADIEINVGEMSLNDMIEDSKSNNSSPITPNTNKKVPTTIHNLVALKKKQLEQEETILVKLSERVSAKGPRLSPTQSITRVGILGVITVLLSGVIFFIFANHQDDVSLLWNEASLSLSSSIAGNGEKQEENEEAIEDSNSSYSSSEVLKQKGNKKQQTKGLAKQNYRAKKKKVKNYQKASDFYKNVRYGIDSNSLIEQGKSNRRIIDYKEFNADWLK